MPAHDTRSWSVPEPSYDCAMPTKLRVRLAAAAAATLLLTTLGLAACAPEAAAPTATSPVASETPDPAPEPVAGDVLSPEEAEGINAAWGRLTDDKAYQLPTGEWVLIKGGQPLPANVAQAVEAAIVPPYTASYLSSVFDGAKQEAANAARDAQEAATGRTTAIVIHGMSAVASGEEPAWFVGGDTPGYNGPSRDEALDVAQKWIDQAPHTRILIVVDALG